MSCSGVISSGGANNASIPRSLTCTADAHSPGPAPIRRLSREEYQQSIQGIFGIDITAQLGLLPSDPVVNGYDNQSEALGVNRFHVEGYLSIAEYLASTLIVDNSSVVAIAGCDPSVDITCLEVFLDTVGTRVYRRPMSTEEKSKLLALVASVAGTDVPIHFVLRLRALLQTPQFLFRPELGNANDERPDLLKLTGYEIATRLSYMLWQSSPDQTLLDAAASGKLDAKEGVAEFVGQMIADDRSLGARKKFAHQWLHLSELDEVSLAGLSDALRTSAMAEIDRLLEEYLSDGQDTLGVFTSPFTFLDQELAQHYRIEGSFGAELSKYEWPAGSQRKGYFGTAAFAIGTSGGLTETSIIHRGKFVREMMLCDPLPPPPPGIITDGVDRLESESCRGCHEKMDPIGNGLEAFDVYGAERDSYEDGSPLPATGQVVGAGTENFSGPAGLGEIVANEAGANRCMVTQYFRWVFARSEEEQADSCTLDALDANFTQQGRSFEDLMIAITTSDAFRFRVPLEDL
ncbi:MAG: DUF1592 domain-containing protein [Myxococcales bacterium]|nr:MAG: DUF1592 domain-containing protein [Myxococcales bacterium]